MFIFGRCINIDNWFLIEKKGTFFKFFAKVFRTFNTNGYEAVIRRRVLYKSYMFFFNRGFLRRKNDKKFVILLHFVLYFSDWRFFGIYGNDKIAHFSFVILRFCFGEGVWGHEYCFPPLFNSA